MSVLTVSQLTKRFTGAAGEPGGLRTSLGLGEQLGGHPAGLDGEGPYRGPSSLNDLAGNFSNIKL